jgi:antitoxin PrlF
MKAIVSEKGQVTIPKELRERLGLRAGSVLEFDEERGKLVAKKSVLEDPVESLCGILKLNKTTDELMELLRGPREED